MQQVCVCVLLGILPCRGVCSINVWLVVCGVCWLVGWSVGWLRALCVDFSVCVASVDERAASCGSHMLSQRVVVGLYEPRCLCYYQGLCFGPCVRVCM